VCPAANRGNGGIQARKARLLAQSRLGLAWPRRSIPLRDDDFVRGNSVEPLAIPAALFR
jgi:type IV secretory pathway VirB3-like protein